MALTLVTGVLAFQQIRRGARLEADARRRRENLELERKMLHTQRLASLGRLAAGVAHEINNPLEGMGNYLTMLDEDLRDGRADEARGLARRVREGLESVAEITRRLLDLGSPGTARREEVDLRGAITQAADLVRAQRGSRGVELLLDLPESPAPVAGDRTTLRQLFLNLLLNATQVQGEKGEVRVECRAAGEGWRVTVADRGPGLAPETLRHLFEPFYSTRHSTGLGLAICFAIVRDHGGRISAANRADGGATFTVELPRAVEASPLADAPTEEVSLP
jgi:signal transduction histidine kinase